MKKSIISTIFVFRLLLIFYLGVRDPSGLPLGHLWDPLRTPRIRNMGLLWNLDPLLRMLYPPMIFLYNIHHLKFKKITYANYKSMPTIIFFYDKLFVVGGCSFGGGGIPCNIGIRESGLTERQRRWRRESGSLEKDCYSQHSADDSDGGGEEDTAFHHHRQSWVPLSDVYPAIVSQQ